MALGQTLVGAIAVTYQHDFHQVLAQLGKMPFGNVGSPPRGHEVIHHRGRLHHPQIPAMPCFAFDLFEHFPPRFIPMEELFRHLPLVQQRHQRLQEPCDALQPIGKRALGQGEAVMPKFLT